MIVNVDDDCLRLIEEFCLQPWRGLTTINRRFWNVLGLRRVPRLGCLDRRRLEGLTGRVIHLGIQYGTVDFSDLFVLGTQLKVCVLNYCMLYWIRLQYLTIERHHHPITVLSTAADERRRHHWLSGLRQLHLPRRTGLL